MLRNKTKFAIALFLIFAMTVSIFALPTAFAWNDATSAAVAAGMKWDFPGAENYNASVTRLLLWQRYHDKIPTYVYGVLSPNPVGVGQEITMLLINPVAPPQSKEINDVRYEFSVAITDPDGNTLNLPASGTFKSDATGSAYTKYTPRKVGNYSITIKFHELFYRWYEGYGWIGTPLRDYYGVTLLESTKTYTLVVQEEPVKPTAITSYPLPTEYWTRPIEGQNQEWGQISSNWLNNAKDRNYGFENNRIQTEGIAPNSGHILWTKPLMDGGVVGGDKYFSSPGEVFNPGATYNPMFYDQIIMYGRLYYEVPITMSGDYGNNQGGWMCVDLRTGEKIWGPLPYDVPGSGMPDLKFGYYYDWDILNWNGIANPGWLFAVSGTDWSSVQPRYGTFGQFNVTNVPSGTEVIGPKGEILRYVIQNAGTTANPNWRLLQWNSSRVFPLPTLMGLVELGEFNASTPSAYDWNISLPIANGLKDSISMCAAIYNDLLLCYNGTLTTPYNDFWDDFYPNPETATLWAVSLKPESRGQTLFGPTNYKMTFADGTWNNFIRAGEGVFIMEQLPSCTFSGYSMYTGQKLWEGVPESEINPFASYTQGLSDQFGFFNGIAYGKFFSTGYSGHVLCYDLYNGTLLWTYAAPTHAEIFDYYTMWKGAIADGKIYLGAYEHSPNTPLYKGNRVRCLNATTGEEIWSMLGYATLGTMAVADGVLIYLNDYDQQVYAVGKGPSAMTVEAPMTDITLGSGLVIRGTVTDIAAGTKQTEQAARFPNGVPAVSDDSMSTWMEYVYMQKPRPMDTTGVPITLSVVDANGNYRDIGTTTSDADGFFSLNWKPDIEGKYTVYASFTGSESYWPSHAVTAFNVDPAAATPAPTAAPLSSVADAYFVPAVAGIIVAIAIVGALLAILLLRKRP